MYLDKAGILHATENEKTAEEFAKNGKFVEVNWPCKNGYLMNGRKEITVEDIKKHAPWLELIIALNKLA